MNKPVRWYKGVNMTKKCICTPAEVTAFGSPDPLCEARDHVKLPLADRVAVHEPMPVKNAGPCVQDLVIRDIEARKAVGFERYGTLLQPFNGRDALMDAYQEALDLCQYLRQALEERDAAPAASGAAISGRG